jgi:hypothetical protein
MNRPSPDAATDAPTICGGKSSGGAGSVFAVTPSTVARCFAAPETGSNSRKSVAVTTSARLSYPNATPRGGDPSENVCLAPESSWISVSRLPAVAGGWKFPKCAIRR